MKTAVLLLSKCRPCKERTQRGTECYSNLCQLVFHPGRNLRINCPQHNSIALQLSQLLNKHLLRNGRTSSLQLRETHDSAFLIDSSHGMAENGQLPPAFTNPEHLFGGVRSTRLSRARGFGHRVVVSLLGV